MPLLLLKGLLVLVGGGMLQEAANRAVFTDKPGSSLPEQYPVAWALLIASAMVALGGNPEE